MKGRVGYIDPSLEVLKPQELTGLDLVFDPELGFKRTYPYFNQQFFGQFFHENCQFLGVKGGEFRV